MPAYRRPSDIARWLDKQRADGVIRSSPPPSEGTPPHLLLAYHHRVRHHARSLAGYANIYDHRLERHMRQAFYATDVTVVIEPHSLMCFDALLVASSGCSPEVCGIDT